jgi:hypothetical protein
MTFREILTIFKSDLQENNSPVFKLSKVERQNRKGGNWKARRKREWFKKKQKRLIDERQKC